MSDDYRMRTRLIHGTAKCQLWEYNHHLIPPMSASAAYRLDSLQQASQGFSEFASDEADRKPPIFIYDRLKEPTRGMLEESLSAAEGGDMAVCFSTGMAAVSAALGVTLKAGDELVAHHTLYGCTYSLLTNWLPRFGITSRFTDLRDQAGLDQVVNEHTRVVYFETPVNPTLELIDITAVSQAVRRLNAKRAADKQVIVIVDNTFATPYCQRPLALGADLVVHSLTKDIGGFGTDMGGVVIGPQAFHEQLLMYRKDFGGVLSPKNAWPILVYGLPTLATRMVNQQKSAMKVAQFLHKHPKVDLVSYPGLESFAQAELARRQMISYDGKFAPGFMIYFTLKADANSASLAAERCINYIAQNAYSITLAVSLGQLRTLIEAPYSMTHSALPATAKLADGMSPGGIRLSIGLEDWHDIISDLKAALDQV